MRLNHQRFSALFVIILCSFLCMADCSAQNAIGGNPNDVLAEISDIKVTRELFDNEAKAFSQVANPQAVAGLMTPEGRKDFLRQLVEVTMFQKKAELDGLDKSDVFKKESRDSAIGILAMERMKKVLDAIVIDDATAKKFYDENIKNFTEPDQYHLFQISTESQEKADALLKDIKAGKSFVELAKSSSIDANKANGGDKGFVTLDDVDSNISEAISKLEKDKVSEVIKLPSGVFVIVKYTDKKAGTAKSFDTVAAQIRRDILNTKQTEAFKAEIEKLKKDFKFELDAKVAESIRKDNLTEAEMNAVLAKYDGHEIKVAEVYKDLEQIPSFIRPQILNGEGLNDFLDQHFARILSFYEVDKNFDKYVKENEKLVKDNARRTLVRCLFDKILNPVTVDDEAIKEFYNKNLANFATPAKMHAHHILVADEANAKTIVETLTKDPSKFEEVAKSSSTCPSGKLGGDLGNFSEGQMVPEFESACKTAEVGKIVGPVKTQFGYHIIRVDDKTPAGTMKLEDVKEDIRNQLLPQKQKEVFDAYVESLRKEFNVKVYQDNL